MRFQARILDVSKGYCVVVTDQARRKVTFGLDRVDLQLERFMRHLDFLEPGGKEIQTVNLFVERNTPFTFVEPEVEALPAKPDVSKDKKDAKEKAPVTVKKAEAVSTPATPAATTPAKDSTPTGRKRVPAESVKKPFRING